jgi:polyphenol oxidase
MTTVVDDAFAYMASAAGRVLVSRDLSGLARHVFTTRDLSFFGDQEASDYAELARVFDLDAADVVRVRQIHGRQIVTVRAQDEVGDALPADAIISLDPAKAIAVRVADCVPVLIADRGRRLVAAVHAGWRGTAAGIVTATVRAIVEHGVPASDLEAAIGPSIGSCCYQVSDEVRAACLHGRAAAEAWFTPDGPGHWRLDLSRANADQLTEAGVLSTNVHASRMCTAHHPDIYYSYRRDGPGTGRMVAAIRLAVATADVNS